MLLFVFLLFQLQLQNSLGDYNISDLTNGHINDQVLNEWADSGVQNSPTITNTIYDYDFNSQLLDNTHYKLLNSDIIVNKPIKIYGTDDLIIEGGENTKIIFKIPITIENDSLFYYDTEVNEADKSVSLAYFYDLKDCNKVVFKNVEISFQLCYESSQNPIDINSSLYSYIKELNTGSSQMTSFFNIESSHNILIDNITSIKPYRNHLFLRESSHCSVINSFFDSSDRNGDGGCGYGVGCTQSSHHNLIENNIFRRLRHSMIIDCNANYNVYGFNYSREQVNNIDKHDAGDISIHGHYGQGGAHHNLFEGNRADRINADVYHGSNGSYNTFFRNYLYDHLLYVETETDKRDGDTTNYYKYDNIDNSYIFIGNEGKTEFQKFIDNIRLDTPKPYNLIDVYGYERYNVPIFGDDSDEPNPCIPGEPCDNLDGDGGLIIVGHETKFRFVAHQTWSRFFHNDSNKSLKLISLYKTEKPTFFDSELSWPAIGPSLVFDGTSLSQDIPARKRYCLENPGSCDVVFNSVNDVYLNENVLSSSNEEFKDLKISNYPNPFNPSTSINFEVKDNMKVRIEVFDITGHLIQILTDKRYSSGVHNVVFNAKNLASGVYFYRVKMGDEITLKRMTLLK